MSENTKEIAQRHMKRQRAKKRRFMIFTFLMIVILFSLLVVLVSMLTPIFNIRGVVVEGASRVSSMDVEQSLGISSDLKIFNINKNLMKKRVEALPYVKSAEISRRFFGKIAVKITESKVSGYIESDKSFVVIDDVGKIVDDAVQKPENVMQIKGLVAQKGRVGEKIAIDSDEKFDIILLYISELEKSGLNDKMTMLDVSDCLSVTGIYDNRYDIFFGDKTNLAHKLALMAAAIEHNAPNEMGTIDLRISDNAYLKPDRTFKDKNVFVPADKAAGDVEKDTVNKENEAEAAGAEQGADAQNSDGSDTGEDVNGADGEKTPHSGSQSSESVQKSENADSEAGAETQMSESQNTEQ